MNPHALRLIRRGLLAGVMVCLVAMGGCNRVDSGSATAGIKDGTKPLDSKAIEPPLFNGQQLYTGPHRTPRGMRGLTIIGYNYTDAYVDGFAVDGAGGGNLEVSRGPSGGGKGACCAAILDNTPLPIKVEISWRRDGDAPLCKQTVLLDGPVPNEPNYFEVHFFQDGTIQVAISDYPSPARIALSRFSPAFRHETGNADNDAKFSECKRGR